MNYKTTIILLMGITTFFLSSFSSEVKTFNRVFPLIINDSVKGKPLSIDTITSLESMKFKMYKKKAHASYYADKFNGRRTASGSKFNNNKYTVAHRNLPFGTKLKITNEENGKFVIVEVTDRGPFSKGREIDMTRRAFSDICDNKACGGLKVRIDLVETD